MPTCQIPWDGNKNLRRDACSAAVVAVRGALAAGRLAQTYPSRNITAIIPFAAGNANDITARIVFEQLSKQLGQPIVIESRPGAGGTIGVGQAARAAPDGYTILFHSATFSASYVTHKTLPYDTLNDFIAGQRGRHLAERAGGRAVEGLQDRRRPDRRRQGQAGRAELRLGRASAPRRILPPRNSASPPASRRSTFRSRARSRR